MTVIPPLIFHRNHQQPKWFWSRQLRKQSGNGKALLLNSGEMKDNYTGCTLGVFLTACLAYKWCSWNAARCHPGRQTGTLAAENTKFGVSACSEVASLRVGTCPVCRTHSLFVDAKGGNMVHFM